MVKIIIAISGTLNTFAHELGHGIGGLEHSWRYNGPAKGTTSNLMDYTENTNLLKSQWVLLRNPGYVNTLFDDEEDASKTSGLVAYYFWHEEIGGTFITNPESTVHTNIINNEINLAFKRNFVVRINDDFNYTKEFNSLESIKNAVNKVTNENINTSYAFYKTQATKLETVFYYTDYLGKWRSVSRPPVVYFDMIPKSNGVDYEKQYLQCSDFVELSKFGIKILTSTHYIVRIYRKANNEIDYYKVFTFSGEDVTQKFINPSVASSNRYVVFANGYRGIGQDWDVSDGLVTTTDRFGYWGYIDDGFITRLKPNERYYIDGSFPISTSNHVTADKFAVSAGCSPVLYSCLNSIPNEAGFNIRKSYGQQAAITFLSTIKKDPSKANTKDTLDIVCHSMGYAYTIGFLEALKGKVVFSRIYILAPENACSGGFSDWGQFEEVWQYGANNNPGDAERLPPIFQDGVAPQCEVKGLDALPLQTNGGRAYIPASEVGTMGFVGSHSVYNFKWIFNIPETGPNSKGHVKQR